MKLMTILTLPIFATAFLLLGCLRHANAEPRTIAVEVTVPDPAWEVTIEKIYVKDQRLLVVSSLNRDRERMAPQVISRVSDSVETPAPDYPVAHYVLGKTFGWAQDPHHFIDDPKELEEIVAGAELIFRRDKEDKAEADS